MDWQFNMLLSSPACSCKYLYIDVWGCEEEDYNVASFDDYLNPLVDHVEDATFLTVKYNPDCRGNDRRLTDEPRGNAAHSKFITDSLKDLQMVSLNGDLGFETLSQNGWSDLSNLKGIHLFAPYLEQIDSKTLNSWSKLQVFDCSPCPSLNNVNFLSQASDKLPRLRAVNLEGVVACSNNKFGLNGLSSYHCTDRSQPSAGCETISEWLVDHLENQVQQAIATECQEPSCDVFLNAFESVDGVGVGQEPDALLDKDEFVSYLQYVGFPNIDNLTAVDAYSCMISNLREHVPFAQTLDEDLEASDGMTLHEFLASQTAATNCAGCDRTQTLVKTGAAVFENQKNSECKEINLVNVEPIEFQATCFPNNAACIPECSAYIRYNQIFDVDHDGFFSEAEYITARSHENLPNGQLNCFFALAGSDCVNDSDGLANLKMPLTNVISLGMWQDNITELSSCDDCFLESNENNVAYENEVPCEDTILFQDAHDNTCGDWQSSDCTDWLHELTNGYTIFDLHEVVSNCPFSCGFCQHSGDDNEFDGICQDNIEFEDAHGHDCTDWTGHSCSDWEHWFGKYTYLDLQQVQLNCPVSCKLCEPPADQIEITCRDKFGFEDYFERSCSYWQSRDCSDWSYHMAESGYTREQLKQVLINCPASCDICQGTCDHTCLYLNDFVCDDGGPGSDYAVCPYGTDCNDCCTRDPERPECADSHTDEHRCFDVVGYTDAKSQGCVAHVATGCAHYELLEQTEGYSAEEMIDIAENCPYSCGRCEPPEGHAGCADVAGWVDDQHEIPCWLWGGAYNCWAEEYWPALGYTEEFYTAEQLDQLTDFIAVINANCPLSCSLCPDRTGVAQECLDVPGYQDGAWYYSCSEWAVYPYFCLNDEVKQNFSLLVITVEIMIDSGYSTADMVAVERLAAEIHENCAYSCGLCQSSEDQDEDDNEDADGICFNDPQTCDWIDDGACDDGGPGADYLGCPYGGDCNDCGIREDHCASYEHEDGNGCSDRLGCTTYGGTPCNALLGFDCLDYEYWSTTYGLISAQVNAFAEDCPYSCGFCAEHQNEDTSSAEGICLNDEQTCNWLNDGQCNDGGPGADYVDCPYGSDCNDCGVRENVCAGYDYGDPDGCSDGNGCITFGTPCHEWSDVDCLDTEYWEVNMGFTAHEALEITAGIAGSCPYSCGLCDEDQDEDSSSLAGICLNDEELCDWLDDGNCDDGGPGHDYVGCHYGTDCNDCGVREDYCGEYAYHNGEGCSDSLGCATVYGNRCDLFQGFDCLDYQHWTTTYGLSVQIMDIVAEQCQYSCGLCDGDQDTVSPTGDPTSHPTDDASTPCLDAPGYSDASGAACFTWIGRDCSDSDFWGTYGFTADDLSEIAQNCKQSCGLCDQEPTDSPTISPTQCADVEGYMDGSGAACWSWIGRDCSDQEFWGTYGFTTQDMNDIAENCKQSCGFC